MTAELHALLGAYALDALDPVERKQFELHLGGCALCQSELVELQAAASRLDEAKLPLRSVDEEAD